LSASQIEGHDGVDRRVHRADPVQVQQDQFRRRQFAVSDQGGLLAQWQPADPLVARGRQARSGAAMAARGRLAHAFIITVMIEVFR
jgi:hypothetical protein